jgi:hypothetical protein
MSAPKVATPVDLLVALKTLGFSTWGVYGWLERARAEHPIALDIRNRFAQRYNTAPADICRTLAIHIARLPKTRPYEPRDPGSVRAAYPAEEVEHAIYKAYCKALVNGAPVRARTGPFAHVYIPGQTSAQYKSGRQP